MTKIKHAWTNGQVERMIRTIKDATVRHFHYDAIAIAGGDAAPEAIDP